MADKKPNAAQKKRLLDFNPCPTPDCPGHLAPTVSAVFDPGDPDHPDAPRRPGLGTIWRCGVDGTEEWRPFQPEPPKALKKPPPPPEIHIPALEVREEAPASMKGTVKE